MLAATSGLQRLLELLHCRHHGLAAGLGEQLSELADASGPGRVLVAGAEERPFDLPVEIAAIRYDEDRRVRQLLHATQLGRQP